uniref:Ig-like domain-containing protein n=1 Tax=Erpetoichthys calabaricus TaxID=27687 RepID=A0A8C4SYL1_ERPCA
MFRNHEQHCLLPHMLHFQHPVFWCPWWLFLTMRPSWQVVYYGETVTLSCQMNIDIPGLQYQWYKDGKRLQALYAVGHRVESHIYSIGTIMWSDQGEYKCQAHSGNPSVQLYTSKPLVLNQERQPSVWYTRVKKEHEGRYKCVVFSGEILKASSEEVNITVRGEGNNIPTSSVSPCSDYLDQKRFKNGP